MGGAEGRGGWVVERVAAERTRERSSERGAFAAGLGLDPFTASDAELAQAAQPLGFAGAGADRDVWLELLMGSLIGPRLRRWAPTFLHGYPATQAALARLEPPEPRAGPRIMPDFHGHQLDD